MNFATIDFKRCSPTADRADIEQFYFAVRTELGLPDRTAITDMVDTIFAHGGVIGGYDNGRMVAALGYFFGDPADHFAHKEILFLYVGAILPAYRGARVFRDGFLFAIDSTRQRGVTHIRLQAQATNSFTNALYRRFANPIGRSRSLRGAEVIAYEAPISQALARMAVPRRPAPAL